MQFVPAPEAIETRRISSDENFQAMSGRYILHQKVHYNKSTVNYAVSETETTPGFSALLFRLLRSTAKFTLSTLNL